MTHRADVPIDQESAATLHRRSPRHARWLTPEETKRVEQEEAAYRSWCKIHHLDPHDPWSAYGYERVVGFLYDVDPPGGGHG